MRNATPNDHHEAKRQQALRDLERIGSRRLGVTDVMPGKYGSADPSENDPDFYARRHTWLYAPLIIVVGLIGGAALLFFLIH